MLTFFMLSSVRMVTDSCAGLGYIATFTDSVSVTKMDEASLETYNKASRYELHVVTYEEMESELIDH